MTVPSGEKIMKFKFIYIYMYLNYGHSRINKLLAEVKSFNRVYTADT